MNWQAAVFLVLVVNQLLATGVFIGLYRRLDWRRSDITRHLMFWSTAAGAVDASWLLILVVKAPTLIYLLYVTLGVVGGLTWYRNWLVVRSLRAPALPLSPAEVALVDLRTAILDPAATVEGLRLLVRRSFYCPDG